MQKGQPVQYASRVLTQTKQNYAQIETEMLSIVFGFDRVEKYVYVRQIIAENDRPFTSRHDAQEEFVSCFWPVRLTATI